MYWLWAVAIFLAVFVTRLRQPYSEYAESLALVPLFILLTASLPWFFISPGALLPAIYVVIMVLCLWHMYDHRLKFKDLGLTIAGPGKMLQYAALGLLLGVPLGVAEYYVLRPQPLYSAFQYTHFLRDAVYMFFFVGVAEVVLFQGIIQRSLTKVFGAGGGLLLASALFMLVHMNWRSTSELGFTFASGLVLGYFYYRTRNLAGPIILHGVSSILLVAVMPYVS